jgi:SAM-dependent methyltransferase
MTTTCGGRVILAISYHHSMDPILRFSTRAQAYSRGRPGYPDELLPLLERECGLTAESQIADIGSGTGLLARLFLDYGCAVTGVEPNAPMRAAGDRDLSAYPRFRSVDGRAEATGLETASVDLITAGQAFHWFEPEGTRAEFQRILRPGGWVALIWNEIAISPGFMAEYKALQERIAKERPHPTSAEFTAFFGGASWKMEALPNSASVDEEMLCARMSSSSWAPKSDTGEHDAMIAELRQLFAKYAEGGHVTMMYETRVYWGRVS